MSHTVLHTRGRWKFSLADIKKIFCRSDLWSKTSHVLVVAAWNVFPIHSLPTPKHSMAVLTSFGNPLILAFAKIIFFSGKICQAASSTHTMWLNDFLGSINTLLYIWLKLWKFELSFSVFTFLRTVLLSFWVTVRQLNRSFAGRNSVFNLTKTKRP